MERDNDMKRIIDYFKARDEVSALYLFGSAAKGKQNTESDIDIAVLIDEKKLHGVNFALLKQDYYAASPRLSIRSVDIVILNTAPPHLKHHILKNSILLFDKNRRLRVRFATNAILEYLDFRLIEDVCLKVVTGRFRGSAVGR
jgi:predicted nucleotidyltransferase